MEKLLNENNGKQIQIDYLYKVKNGKLFYYSDTFYTWAPVNLKTLDKIIILRLVEVLKDEKN